MAAHTTLAVAIVGAGPVGLTLALHAARTLPHARIDVFDARAADHDLGADRRTLALSLGSVQLLRRLMPWPASAQAITQVHVSQQPPTLPGATVRIRAADVAVPMLGAVLTYGALVAPLQQAWLDAVAADPGRLRMRFASPVTALKATADGVEVDAGIADGHDIAVVAEGGVFADQARKALVHDYAQTAWVGSVTLAGATPGAAFERFTRHGPAALLPLGGDRAALVWCVASADDPVRDLTDAQRVAVLNSVFPTEAGRITAVSALKAFALGLNAERTLVGGRTAGDGPGRGRLNGEGPGQGRLNAEGLGRGRLNGEGPGRGRVVRIGNAAQTLHPVAGQGLNLGLRDAYALVAALRRGGDIDAALRRVEWARAPDRWAMIAATDFLARSFTWQLPGMAALRGAGLAALDHLPPAKGWLARRMMFGSR